MLMKLMHLGDLHIGKSLNDYSLIDDQKYILNQILSIIDEQAVEILIIAGDIYDKAIPSEEAVRIFNDFICQLAVKKIKTFIISGNHDSDERLNFGSSLFKLSGIYISTKYERKLFKYSIEHNNNNVNIYLLPFVKASTVKHYFPDEQIDSYDKAVRVILQNEPINKNEINILAAHQFVAGKNEQPVIGGSENASVKNIAVPNVGNVEKIGYDCFDDFDYVALGHIHSPQKIGKDTIRYAGSPLKYSISEIENNKSIPIISIDDNNTIDIDLIKLQPLRDIRHLIGKMEQLLNKNHITNPDDYIYVTLTDENPIENAITIIRQYYPNTLKLDYKNLHTGNTELIDLAKVTREKSFEELISDFYNMMFGCEMNEDEMKILLDTAKEAGITDETN